jgi:type I restriction enzyme S subunit
MREIFDCSGRITSAAMQSSNTKILPLNSVMIALNGQGKTRGTVAMLRTEATCNQSLVSIFPKDLKILIPEFIFYNLNMRYLEIRRITGDDGNDRRGLNMSIIRDIEIPLPPVEIQNNIVNKIIKISSEIEKLKNQSSIEKEKISSLRQSILSHVFNFEEKAA